MVIPTVGCLGELIWGWFQETGRLPPWAMEKRGGRWPSSLFSRWREHRRARANADDVWP
jgi:hypothetical protein